MRVRFSITWYPLPSMSGFRVIEGYQFERVFVQIFTSFYKYSPVFLQVVPNTHA
jgi:hypothetical protein